jgi:hypothetical protein
MIMTLTLKVCKKHGALSVENTYLRKNKNYSECKLCQKEKRIEWVKNNKEKYRLAQKKAQKKYREENKEKRKESCKKYYNLHKEKIAIKSKEYYSKNPEKRKLAWKKYQKENREAIWEKKKNKYYSNLEKNRKIRRVNAKKYYEKNKNIIIDKKRQDVVKLNDHYIISCLTQRSGLRTKDIPQELILAKREHIKLKRKIKEIKNGN